MDGYPSGESRWTEPRLQANSPEALRWYHGDMEPPRFPWDSYPGIRPGDKTVPPGDFVCKRRRTLREIGGLLRDRAWLFVGSRNIRF